MDYFEPTQPARRIRIMTPEEFREAGHQLIDWIADYRNYIDDSPVKASANPGDVKAKFEPSVPDQPLSFPELLTCIIAKCSTR